MKTRRTLGRLLIALLAMGLATACSDDGVEGLYASDRASFICRSVSTIAPLRTALNSYGEFCMIYADVNYYHFASPTVTAPPVPKTQQSLYQSYICHAGFIVGKGGIVELGSADYPLLCYDLVCPNCFRENSITRRLAFAQQQGIVVCNSCHRHYDLNNLGVIVQGDKGRKLLRYHISYAADVMAISN